MSRASGFLAAALGLAAVSCDVTPAEDVTAEPADRVTAEPAGGTMSRPSMRQLEPATSTFGPPPPQDLVEARAALKRRVRELLGRGRSAANVNAAAAALIDGAVAESDPAIRWLMLLEARRLAADAGNAEAVERSIVLAAAIYEFDAIDEEYRTLVGIPLRGLDAARAAGVARVAERLSDRAEAEGRVDLAVSAQDLAIRGWQRAGDGAAARRAATRLTALEPGRVPGRR